MTSLPDQARTQVEARGRRAEAWASWLLRAKGYAIVARRFRCSACETDLIARRGRTLVFVEVKTRDSIAAALESVGPRQRTRIGAAARAFLGRQPGLAGGTLRFDVIALAPRRLPRHIVDAWQEGS